MLVFLLFPPKVSCQDYMPGTKPQDSIQGFYMEGGNDLKGENTGRHIIEVAHGQAFVDWTDAWGWFFCGNYLYRFGKNVALGAGAGLQFDWQGIYPVISLNSILGNKSDGFAFGGDIKYIFTDIIESSASRLWITGGVYYKDFFVKMMPTFLFGYPEEWYFETGYSLSFGK